MTLLSRMTTHEKVMQLNQYTLGGNNNENNVGEVAGELPAEVGSVIYYNDNPDLRNAYQRRCMEESRLGIPWYFRLRYDTWFPHDLSYIARAGMFMECSSCGAYDIVCCRRGPFWY